MTTEHDAAHIVRSWLQRDAHESADRILGVVLDRIDTLPQRRPLWPVRRASFVNRTLAFATAALATVLVAGIGLAVFLSRPAVGPAVTPSPSPTPDVSASPSPSPVAPRFVYLVSRTLPIDEHNNYVYQRIWIANGDGLDAHELLPDPSVVGDEPAGQGIVGWLPDGSGLLYTEGWSEGTVDLFMTDADGSEPRLICPANDCPSAANGAISPDGREIAFAPAEGTDGISILDRLAGQVDTLDVHPPTRPEGCDPNASAVWRDPRWTADGAQLQFTIDYWNGLFDGQCGSVVVAVNKDGSNLRILAADEHMDLYPKPSPGVGGRLQQPLP